MCGCTTSSDAATESAAVNGGGEELLESQVYADDGLCTTVELHVSCQNLADKDVFSKSDPFAILYFKNKKKYVGCNGVADSGWNWVERR